MKKIFWQLFLLIPLVAVMVDCTNEEIRYIDPMINGICDKADVAIQKINSDSWNSALVEFRNQRLKLFGMEELIGNDGYTGDNYTLTNPEQSVQRVKQTLQRVEFKMDSVWKANIQNAFDAVNENSAGIQNFGRTTYANTDIAVSDAYHWLMAESEDMTGEDLVANDFLNLQNDISVLTGLAALNDQEVIDFVNNIKGKYDKMKQEYTDLAPVIASSAYFTKGQKTIYAGLEQPLIDMQTTINENLSLATKDQLDLIDRDLSALVYFVENNNTSPAQKPLVYGEISSITELRWLSEQATGDDRASNWILTADIDAAETHRWNNGVGFLAIKEFSGIFDGQYHIISGLLINQPPGTKTGFIGTLTAGQVLNLGIVNVDATVSGNQGGVIVGLVTNGSITNSFTHGKIGAAGQSGGFIGRSDGGIFTNCFSSVATTWIGGNNMGGFIGLTTGTVSLINCYATGKITGGGSVTYAIIGSASVATASGVYFDSSTIGLTSASNQISFNGGCVDLPVSDWGNLSNFSGFSSDIWEIKTLPEIDANPRPYLKGFNYDELKDFIIPE